MKKLIAIAVVFVLAVGVAFAADVGAQVIAGVNALKGDSADGSKVTAGNAQSRGRVWASGQNDEGNFGAWARFETYWHGGTPGLSGYAWWKPHDIFKLQFGTDPDGEWSQDGVTRWGFYQVASDANVAIENWKFGASFYEGFGAIGAYLTLTPLDPLEIHIGIPIVSASGEAKDVYQKLHGQVAYNLGGIGKVALSYVGNLNNGGSISAVNAAGEAATAPASGKIADVAAGTVLKNDLSGNGSKLFAYFGLTAIENLSIDLGVGYTLPVTWEKVAVNFKDGKSITVDLKEDLGMKAKDIPVYSAPIGVGLGVKFDAGALGIKARVQGEFAEQLKVGGSTIKGDMKLTADLMPYFAVTDSVTAHLSTGLAMSKPDGGGDSTVAWHIEPYVTVKASWWAPNFYAGFRFDSDGTGSKVVNWSVPIGLVVEF
jgi:hypothetical protein